MNRPTFVIQKYWMKITAFLEVIKCVCTKVFCLIGKFSIFSPCKDIVRVTISFRLVKEEHILSTLVSFAFSSDISTFEADTLSTKRELEAKQVWNLIHTDKCVLLFCFQIYNQLSSAKMGCRNQSHQDNSITLHPEEQVGTLTNQKNQKRTKKIPLRISNMFCTQCATVTTHLFASKSLWVPNCDKSTNQ